jgi:hypothetical protein
MSTFDSDDLETTGYFLPEDSWLRLKKLHGYVEFLANLARPRTADERQEWTAEIRVGEVAICLELMAEQIELVLDELSWPAKRGERAAAPEVKAESEVEPKLAAATEAADTDDAKPDLAADEPGDPYAAGVTLGQIDELARLGDILRAHGDVVVATDQADFADATLSIMGDAILRDAERLRDIIRDVDRAQRLDETRPRTGVEEEHAVYCIEHGHLSMDVMPHGAWPLPAGRSRTQLLTVST